MPFPSFSEFLPFLQPETHFSRGGTAYLRRLGRALSVTALRKIRESYFSLRAICRTDKWLLFF